MSRPDGDAVPAPVTLEEALATVTCLDGRLHAFTRIAAEPGGPGALSHWPVALKDNIEVAGEPLGLGRAVEAWALGQVSAPVVERLRAAGAAIVGRTHMVEHAFGGWGLNAALGAPRNPWDLLVHRVAGGSSSGAAVAVAAGMARIALGTDTAGSVRMPAALCGVTGFKPSFGRYPTEGVFPLAPSYDSVGLLARDVADISRADAVLAAAEPLAQPALPPGAHLAVLDLQSWPAPVQPPVRAALEHAARVFAGLGLRLQTVMPPFDLAELTRDAGTLIAAEAWTVHREAFTADPAGYGAEMQRRLRAARDADPARVTAARAARAAAKQVFGTWLSVPDAPLAVLLPAVPCSAPRIEEVSESGSPLGLFVRWVNHVGGCAISLPAGFDDTGLPLAVQLVGRAGTDAVLLALSAAFQGATDWHRRRPMLDAAIK